MNYIKAKIETLFTFQKYQKIDMQQDALPTQMSAAAVIAEMMLRSDIDFQVLNDAAGIEVSDRVVKKICETNPTITKLSLNSCMWLTDFSMVSIGKHCKNLQAISLSGCNGIGRVGLRSIALSCSNLCSVNLSGYCVDDGGLRILASSLNKLETLDLTGCSSVTDRGLSQIAHCCTKLRILKLGGCHKIGESGGK